MELTYSDELLSKFKASFRKGAGRSCRMLQNKHIMVSESVKRKMKIKKEEEYRDQEAEHGQNRS